MNNTKDVFSVFTGDTTSQEAQAAIKNQLDVVSAIEMEMLSDDENESLYLLDLYVKGTARERSIMDSVIVALCGWTMSTIIKKADPMTD